MWISDIGRVVVGSDAHCSSTGSTFQGTAQAFHSSPSTQPLLIAAAIFAVYVVLGILYESFIQPVTSLMSLPPASVGAELRQPLGVAVVGGLAVSQALPLFTIPVTCLYMERLGNWLSFPGGRPSRAVPGIGRPRRPADLAQDRALVPAGNHPRPTTIHSHRAE